MQKEVVVRCRQLGKPVIVASHLLQSMIEYPTPTRAEVRLEQKPVFWSSTHVLALQFAWGKGMGTGTMSAAWRACVLLTVFRGRKLNAGSNCTRFVQA